uniref:Uncharacterized protein n=1 Tax=Capra hircus TaxID=9925 RepID=A0A8C2NL65_CAPHI
IKLMEKVKPQILKCNYALSEGLLKIREYICWNNCNGYYSLKVSERKGSCGLQETFSAFFWMFFSLPICLCFLSLVSLSPLSLPLSPTNPFHLSLSLCLSHSVVLSHSICTHWHLFEH